MSRPKDAHQGDHRTRNGLALSAVALAAGGTLSACATQPTPDNVYSSFGRVATSELERAFADGEYRRGEIDWRKFHIEKRNTSVLGGGQPEVSGIIRDMESAVVATEAEGGHHTAKSDGVAKCLEALLLNDIRDSDTGAAATGVLYAAPTVATGLPGIAAVVTAPEWGPAVYNTVLGKWLPAAYHEGQRQEEETQAKAAADANAKKLRGTKGGWEAEQGDAYADWGTLCRSDRVQMPVDLAGTVVDTKNRAWSDSTVFQLCGPKDNNPCDYPSVLGYIGHAPNVPFTLELADGVVPSEPSPTPSTRRALSPVGVVPDRRSSSSAFARRSVYPKTGK